jgi:hypothetical protein
MITDRDPFVKKMFQPLRCQKELARKTAGRSPPFDSNVPQETLPLVPRREKELTRAIGSGRGRL